MAHDVSREKQLRLARSELRKANGLTNTSDISDEYILSEIEAMIQELKSVLGYMPVLKPESSGYNALRYYGLIRASYYLSDDRGPSSISHARRFDYTDSQRKFWRNRMIRALSQL